MLRWYEDKMPRDISKGKRDVEILGIRWMVKQRGEENKGVLKEEVMRDGVKKGVFRVGNSSAGFQGNMVERHSGRST